MNALERGSSLKRDSTLLNLSPFYDRPKRSEQVVVWHREFIDSKKVPYLISKASTLAVLILRYYHGATLHGGGLLTLNTSREEFWILNGKDTTRRVIKDCFICSRFENKPLTQMMADLPMERITIAEPFQTVGIPRFRRTNLHQSYGKNIAVFVCFVIKAVHIELVENLAKEACMSAIKRFTAR